MCGQRTLQLAVLSPDAGYGVVREMAQQILGQSAHRIAEAASGPFPGIENARMSVSRLVRRKPMRFQPRDFTQFALGGNAATELPRTGGTPH